MCDKYIDSIKWRIECLLQYINSGYKILIFHSVLHFEYNKVGSSDRSVTPNSPPQSVSTRGSLACRASPVAELKFVPENILKYIVCEYSRICTVIFSSTLPEQRAQFAILKYIS